jgi:hypothetical protein
MAMPTKEVEFKQRFVALMEDLKDHRSKPEAMFFVGNLAANLIDKAGAKDWRAYKADLGSAHRALLLAELQKRGNGFAAQGKTKQTYAIQVLAMSIVGGEQDDAHLLEGVKIIDKLIAFYVGAYRKASAMNKAKAAS